MRTIDADVLFGEMEKAQWYNNADRDEIAEELVLNAPTIEPERKTGRWIPCSERLPEENSDILVTYVEKDEKRIVPVNYGCGTWFDCFFNKVLNQVGVLAWMPLPEPYREEGD